MRDLRNGLSAPKPRFLRQLDESHVAMRTSPPSIALPASPTVDPGWRLARPEPFLPASRARRATPGRRPACADCSDPASARACSPGGEANPVRRHQLTASQAAPPEAVVRDVLHPALPVAPPWDKPPWDHWVMGIRLGVPTARQARRPPRLGGVNSNKPRPRRIPGSVAATRFVHVTALTRCVSNDLSEYVEAVTGSATSEPARSITYGMCLKTRQSDAGLA